MGYDPVDLERLLVAGEWLRTGQVAALLGLSRTTVHELCVRGRIRHKKTPGGQRLCHPEDVSTLLAESRQVHGDDAGE